MTLEQACRFALNPDPRERQSPSRLQDGDDQRSSPPLTAHQFWGGPIVARVL
ncbi:MAG TPA: hypothetical protein VFA45_19455 [Actinomycetes bacterium]|nr:hypothetical protein [Actinomycetes bacterium]